MCGRYSLIAEPEELAPRFEFDPADFADQPQTRTSVQRRAHPASVGRNQSGPAAGRVYALGPDTLLGRGRRRRKPPD